jgi:hypothetical protein
MTFARAVTGFSAATLLALVALAPLPAVAGPTVYSADMVCANVTFGPLMITQNLLASGHANLTLTGAGNANLSLTVKASGLPGSAPAACAVVCVVDGIQDLFDFAAFEPCGTITAGGKLTFTGTVVPFSDEPFQGGCLLPVPALLVEDVDSLLLCTTGFGTFLQFPPPCVAC